MIKPSVRKVLMQVSFAKFSKFGLLNISAKANRPILLHFFECCLHKFPNSGKFPQKTFAVRFMFDQIASRDTFRKTLLCEYDKIFILFLCVTLSMFPHTINEEQIITYS